MSRASATDREKFVARLARELYGPERSPEYIATVAQKIMRASASFARIKTDECNGPEYDGCRTDADYRRRAAQWQAHLDALPAKSDRLRKRISALASDIGCTGVVFQGDPRGCTVKVKLPSGHTDDWAREGVCVPTA